MHRKLTCIISSNSNDNNNADQWDWNWHYVMAFIGLKFSCNYKTKLSAAMYASASGKFNVA